jgi:SAM-dependent methyltransferase
MDTYAVIAKMYDGDYEVARTPSGDVDFYVEEARACGGKVLELGCGTGRIMLPILDAGVDIEGMDSSRAMLKVLAAKREGIDTRLHEGDMTCTVFPFAPYRLVTIPFRALGHVMEREQHVGTFRSCFENLQPGGRLVFDVFQPNYGHLAEPRENVLGIEREEDGRKIRRYHSAVPHPSRQRIDVTFRWEIEDAEGNVEELTEAFPMRWFHRYELEHAIEAGGFELEAVHGDFDRSELTDASPEMIFVCRKPESGKPAGRSGP